MLRSRTTRTRCCCTNARTSLGEHHLGIPEHLKRYSPNLNVLVAVCAGSDLMHPIGALITGVVAGGVFVFLFTFIQNRWHKADDVLGVWPLHGVCGAWGGIAAGIFGLEAFGGLGGVSFMSQLAGSLLGILIAFIGGYLVYKAVDLVSGIRLSEEEEFNGADLSIHKIGATSHD